MKKTNRFFKSLIYCLTLLQLFLVVFSCSNQVTDNDLNKNDIPLLVFSRLNFGNSSTTEVVGPEMIAKGQLVYLWGDSPNRKSYIKSWRLMSDGIGGFNSDLSQYYPAGNKKLSIYGIHGNFVSDFIENKTSFPESALLHHVSVSQQLDNDEYEKSDLLYGVLTNLTSSKQAITLPFYHLLSKIEIVLRAGNGLTDMDMKYATVKILNTKTMVEFLYSVLMVFSSSIQLV